MNSLFARVFLRGLIIGTVMAALGFGTIKLMEMLDSGEPEGDPAATAATMKERPLLYMDLPGGRVTIELLPDIAPKHVARITELATQGFYDGVAFHRVVEDFVAQGGDPTGTGRGETGYVIPDELRDELAHDRAGILSMANRGPGTGNAQFFVTLGPAPHLDDRHTVFGVCDEASVDVAEHIAALRGAGDRPTTPQVIDRVEIVRR